MSAHSSRRVLTRHLKTGSLVTLFTKRFTPMSEARGTHAAFFVASVAGLEPTAYSLGENCSIH